jgi:inosose dehydratase
MSKIEISRRSFVAGAIAVPSFAAAVQGAFAAEGYTGYVMGAQSYSFRHFKFPEPLTKLKELGLNNMEFCSAHFPPDATAPGFADVKKAIEQSGVKVVAYGVENFTKDDAANRKKFEFAKALGIGILSASPEADSFDSLDKLCSEFNIKIAIHNHGPKDERYGLVAKTLKAIDGRNPLIGACVDTGHVIRAGEKPHEVVKALGARVHSLHLKDWIYNGEEQIPGKGELDMVALARELKALKFTGPIDLEYEKSEENPVPDMKIGLKNWEEACKKA